MSGRPLESIAIAGAWGYIGRKFLDAAQSLGMQISVFDPGVMPVELDGRAFARVDSEEAFYRSKADLFHLALHPEHRHRGIEILLERGRHEPVVVLCEKPMASPRQPEECVRMVQATDASNAVFLYDFPELFDPITQRIRQFLGSFREVVIESLYVQRSKDREDPEISRNYKRMVTIQYQESVHCLAFVLSILAEVAGGLPEVFGEGLELSATSAPYRPPNPDAYPHVVDGKCEYRLKFGAVTVEGRTDFTRNAEWTKRRIIQGRGDGRPFRIEVDFLEDAKHLAINEEIQRDVIQANSYSEVIRTIENWLWKVPHEQLMDGLYPNPRFAQATFQLSSALWRSSQDRNPLSFGSLDDLLAFDADYAHAHT